MEGLEKKVKKLLEQNTRTSKNFTYTVPSNTSYPYQWFWDSCFHAILWTKYDSRRAQQEIESLLHHQHQNGFIGHVTYWEPAQVLDVDWGIPHTSSLIQPPIIAYAVWRTFNSTQDKEWLHSVYPKIKLFYDYILKNRTCSSTGLIGLINPDESGEDNAPKFDTELQLPPQHTAKENTKRRYALFDKHKNCNFDAKCTSTYFWTEDISFNTYMVWNLQIMADIAFILDKKSDSNTFQAHATELKHAMRGHMFHDGRYRSLCGITEYTIDTSEGWDQFLPMIANLYTHKEALSLVQNKLCNEAWFWRPFGIPTVATNDPAFAPEEPTWGEAWQHPDWRGSVWMVPHWCIYHGLYNYGFVDIAEEIKQKSISLINTSGWRENFHPDTGQGQGAKEFTWGALIIDMENST